MKELKISKETKTLIVSAILLVVGILFCASRSMGITALSYIIGTALILAGVIIVINLALEKGRLLNGTGMLGGALIAFGILFAGNDLAWIIFNYVPWLLIVIGAIIIIDSIIKKVNESNNTMFITELVIGIIVLALGICLRFVHGFADFSSIMLGIVLIIYAVYMFIMLMTKGNKNTSSEKKQIEETHNTKKQSAEDKKDQPKTDKKDT